jgi:hypothetical protein
MTWGSTLLTAELLDAQSHDTDMFCNVNTAIQVVQFLKQETAAHSGELSESEDEDVSQQNRNSLLKCKCRFPNLF